jgi:hypothetical protein
MDPLITQNLENREETRAALTHKLESLEVRLRKSVENVKEAVKRSTDVPYQVSKRPWQMFGLSVAVGCAVGRLFRNGRAEVGLRASRSKQPRTGSANNDTIRNADPYPQQLSVVKGATIGAIASILGELARQVGPTLLAQLEHYSKNKPTSEARNGANETA